ncbi:ARL2_Bind_BART domain-containing protein [Durusdinium trenchii]|uniref:ARL2_Bind_BART domain-containing protein n=1 Tax=Durusdinium trenchii TaxID=1381693 RepID=A0ABP0J5M5_9DINO
MEDAYHAPPPPPAPAVGAEATYERLATLAPVCGSCLEPLVSGFLQDATFRQELQDFIVGRASSFLVLCEDGSYPLVWKAYHNEYRSIFERQMQKILASLSITEAELTELCHWLQSDFGHGFQYDDGLHAFLEAVTASEAYENFLAVMFAEVSRQAGETVEITVPLGLSPGDAFQVTYLGIRYDLQVPENCSAGTFQLSVIRPSKLDIVSLFNVPDSFYGLD